MYSAIHIESFRGFERFHLDGLRRINLLVGANNCGKTSILEGLSLLAAGGDLRQLGSMMVRRGESPFIESARGRRIRSPRVRHLFHGHAAPLGASLLISGVHTEGGSDELKLSVEALDEPEQLRLEVGIDQQTAFVARFEGRAGKGTYRLPISEAGDVDPEGYLRFRMLPATEDLGPVAFISTTAAQAWEVIDLASSIQLTGEEKRVLEALRLLEGDIEDYRPVVPPRRTQYEDADRDCIIVRLRGVPDPVPIGTLGDGVWRVLGLALGLAKAAGRVLLIDEIDTGLHYTVMADTWRMVHRATERLGVQVFATTHSRDCVEALAAVADEVGSDREDITIQRIERDRTRATAYSQPEIVAAAARGIEIR